MTHRAGLAIASLAAIVVLTVGLALAGFGPAPARSAATPVVIAPAAAEASPSASPGVQVDTVYVPAAPTPPTVVEHRVVLSTGGEHEDHEGSEGGGD